MAKKKDINKLMKEMEENFDALTEQMHIQEHIYFSQMRDSLAAELLVHKPIGATDAINRANEFVEQLIEMCYEEVPSGRQSESD